MKSNSLPEPLVRARSHEEVESLTKNHDKNIYDPTHPKEWEQSYLRYKMQYWIKWKGKWVRTHTYFADDNEMQTYEEYVKSEIL